VAQLHSLVRNFANPCALTFIYSEKLPYLNLFTILTRVYTFSSQTTETDVEQNSSLYCTYTLHMREASPVTVNK
jgi:hypothetical protein